MELVQNPEVLLYNVINAEEKVRLYIHRILYLELCVMFRHVLIVRAPVR